MPTLYEGNFATPPGRFALVAARFNGTIVDDLVGGALDGLRRHGVADDAIDLVRVPGSFEIPLAAQRLASSGRYAAVICLGAVIRGETSHYDHVCAEAARGIQDVQLRTGVPCAFGVLTVENMEQALARAGGDKRDQGRHAAEAVMTMSALRSDLH